jgi:hypothetical protein
MLKLVTDVAVDSPDAGRVPLLAIATVGGSLRKAAMGMEVGREREDLKQTCFQDQCNWLVEAVVWFGVCQHMVGKIKQSVLIKISPPCDVENMS